MVLVVYENKFDFVSFVFVVLVVMRRRRRDQR